MDTLSKKTVKTARNLTYTYYVSPATSGLPTLLLCHGFPDTAALWTDLIINHLVPAGYGVVAPDLLGYAGTSKPTDPKAYAWDGMTGDLCEILDAEGLQKIVSVGHDWGSAMAQRMWIFHPERVNGLLLMNVAYNPPTAEPFDLGQLEAMLTPMIGYFTFWYWYLFTAPDGPKILREHLDSLFDVAHAPGETWMDTLCKKDGVRDFLLADKRQEVQPYATDAMRKEFVERFSKDGLEAPCCWYRATVDNIQFEVEKDIPVERHTVTVPTLFVGGSEDKVCLTAGIYPSMQQGLLPHLTIEELQASHWCMRVKPKELGDIVTGWLKKNF